MIVPDASVLSVALTSGSDDGVRLRGRLGTQQLYAPALIDLEVLSVWRRWVRTGRLTDAEARRAIDSLRSFPLGRVHHQLLTERCWALHETVTPYDAAYVAVAELLDASLLTGDRRLARAPGIRCRVEVLS